MAPRTPKPGEAFRRRTPLRLYAPVAILLGAALPGLGQLYVGRPGKALLMLLPIAALFLGGLAFTDFTAIDPQGQGLWGIAHMGIPGPAFAVWKATEGRVLVEPLRFVEMGRLYVALAGLLNIVAICDAWGTVLRHNERRERWLFAWQRRDLRRRVHVEVQPPLSPSGGGIPAWDALA